MSFHTNRDGTDEWARPSRQLRRPRYVTDIRKRDLPHLWSHDEAEFDDSQIVISIRKRISERYNLLACICLDDNDWPISYGYWDTPTGNPSTSEHFPVTFIDRWVPEEIFRDWHSAWLKLNDDGQDMLYTILSSAILISERTYFSPQKKEWHPRKDHPTPSEIPDMCTLLTDYGVIMEKSSNVLEYLARGQEQAEVLAMLGQPVYCDCKKELANAWASALVAGMTDGVGCSAISELMKAVVRVLRGLKITVPPITVLNDTSSLRSDSFNDSGSSSSNSTCTPDAKRKKLDDQSENSCQSKTEKPCKKQRIVQWPPEDYGSSHHQFVDMAVVTQENSNDVAKFLLVIEVISKGKTEDKAGRRFMRELIYVLQSQSEVFGLLFSETKVHMYHAKKDKTGEISIASDIYKLVDYVCADGILHVAEFQRLVMDVFTCLAYGINCIDA